MHKRKYEILLFSGYFWSPFYALYVREVRLPVPNVVLEVAYQLVHTPYDRTFIGTFTQME
jgi:hypothetical protein